MLQRKILRHHRQIRIVVWIPVPKNLRPSLLEDSHLVLESSYLLRISLVKSAGLGLVVIQLRVRIIDDQITGLSYLHAEIYIVKGYSQLLRETAHLIVNTLLHHKACSRDCAHILLNCAHILLTDDSVLVPCLAALLINEGVTRDSAPSDDDAGVLDRVVFIIQSGADRSDVRSHTETEHLADHILADELRIVIQEE